ncbi:MAG TPA: T9SS type A sorting domain-containing protein, partial [Bacteroidales bacterium]|nr:T9SS type A sorting domain-containing protein [Bacteroidales bacterium]
MKKWFIVLILALAISFAGFAQDYMIFFQGGMESQMVDSVAVKNLANGAEVKIGGSDVVHLLPEAQIRALSLPCGSITVYPNPLVSSCQVLFTTGLAGNVTIRLFDISGKCVMSEVQTL